MAIILGGFGYFIFKRFVFDLVGEVYDEGDALVVKNGGREERVPLANIINVIDSVATNPPRTTLTLRTPNAFGGDNHVCSASARSVSLRSACVHIWHDENNLS
jgi:hypothetical protein